MRRWAKHDVSGNRARPIPQRFDHGREVRGKDGLATGEKKTIRGIRQPQAFRQVLTGHCLHPNRGDDQSTRQPIPPAWIVTHRQRLLRRRRMKKRQTIVFAGNVAPPLTTAGATWIAPDHQLRRMKSFWVVLRGNLNQVLYIQPETSQVIDEAAIRPWNKMESGDSYATTCS